ncbi:MAG TPA: hypothetical protein ENJ12_06825 [Thiolapillus brandeum]|uniref:Uncharacterized protein n=1 Tax=Thiolapillus brandeum TaxID=1076588 RepID=A0A831WBL1_9GAMM|nr:hypothetical protein [Thiolapillus brandeum]
MTTENDRLDAILNELAPVLLPPADYPPAYIVRDTPRDELMERIRRNAGEVGIDLTEAHYEVIRFVLDFYAHCCAADQPGYTDFLAYWRQVDSQRQEDKAAGDGKEVCRFGRLSAREATNAYRVYRVLLKAFADKGGKRYLYRLFPYGPVFTIHLLARLPRLRHDVDPHFGTAY